MYRPKLDVNVPPPEMTMVGAWSTGNYLITKQLQKA